MNGDQRIIPAPPDLDPTYNYGYVPERNAAVFVQLAMLTAVAASLVPSL
jgi:hypothetical protein